MTDIAAKLRIIVVFRADLPEMTRAKGEVQFGHAIDGVLEKRVARAISPETFDLPRINLYRDDYKKAFDQARAAIAAMEGNGDAPHRQTSGPSC